MAARKAVSTPVWNRFGPDPARSLKIPANHLEKNRRDHQSKKAKRQRREEAAVHQGGCFGGCAAGVAGCESGAGACQTCRTAER
jgi:hypothetical protein